MMTGPPTAERRLIFTDFLDHVMREGPSKSMITIKRNFFAKGEARFDLGTGVQAAKGVYASIRPTLSAGGLPSLAVNVDVANTTFWTKATLIQAANSVLGTRDPQQLTTNLGAGGDGKSARIELLRSFRGVNVITKHLGEQRSYKIRTFLKANARTYTFNYTDQKTGRSSVVSLADYFRTTYRINLAHPNLPVLETTKQLKESKSFVCLPMELCDIREDQRFALKLSDTQTSNMIKFAVTLPDQRWGAIEKGLGHLGWAQDRYMANYGLKITDKPTTVKARVLPNPKILFGGNKVVDPRNTGRWDLRGQRFTEPNRLPLTAWGLLIHPGRGALSKQQGEEFMAAFSIAYKGHGGQIKNSPIVQVGTQDVSASLELLYNTVGKTHNQKSQIIFVIVPSRDSATYNRIKLNGECRWGFVTQVLQADKAGRMQPQYCSNVAMKVNAKLGGVTSGVQGLRSGKFPRSTMVIGADVSHGGAGLMTPSIAAMTVSFDKAAYRYVAAVQTNGIRIEMITKENINSMLGTISERWMKAVGNNAVPAHVIYFRDGVSEGQYAHVLNQELVDMRAVFKKLDPSSNVKFTVVIATKRHHVRFFPDGPSGDKNHNPQPGTLVEKGVTHPFEYDFYLCSHTAIKGTARPVHYHVILDEMNMGVEDLQNFIYESSYSYCRSTTPISLPPPVYYAHLASNRGICHIRKGVEPSDAGSGGYQRSAEDVPKLTPMSEATPIKGTMWYV